MDCLLKSNIRINDKDREREYCVVKDWFEGEYSLLTAAKLRKLKKLHAGHNLVPEDEYERWSKSGEPIDIILTALEKQILGKD